MGIYSFVVVKTLNYTKKKCDIMGRTKERRHYLFTDIKYEEEMGGEVRFDFTANTIRTVLQRWSENLDYKEIALSARITEVECLLLLLDLQMTGKLPKRARDFYGRKIR